LALPALPLLAVHYKRDSHEEAKAGYFDAFSRLIKQMTGWHVPPFPNGVQETVPASALFHAPGED